MSVLTIRDKNQITIPAAVLAQTGLRQGDPIECAALPDGGIAIHKFGTRAGRQSAWDLAVRLADAVPGLQDIDLDLPERDLASHEVVL